MMHSHSIKCYAQENHPKFKNGDPVSVDCTCFSSQPSTRRLVRDGVVIGKGLAFVIDFWIVDFGPAAVSGGYFEAVRGFDSYHFQATMVQHTFMVDDSQSDTWEANRPDEAAKLAEAIEAARLRAEIPVEKLALEVGPAVTKPFSHAIRQLGHFTAHTTKAGQVGWLGDAPVFESDIGNRIIVKWRGMVCQDEAYIRVKVLG